MRHPIVLLSVLSACQETPDSEDYPGAFSLTPSEEVESYVTASWKAPGAESAHLEFSVDGQTQLVTDPVDGEVGSDLPVLGLWFNETFDVELVDQDDTVLAVGTHTIGAGPATLSGFGIEGRPTWDRYVISALLTSDPSSVVMFSPSGQPCWFWELDGPAFIVRATPRRDGMGIWALLMPFTPAGEAGRLLSVDWDGTVSSDLTPYGHAGEGVTHDFIEMEDGSIILIGYDTRAVGGVDYTGDTLYRRHADGTEEPIWSFWDLYTPTADGVDPEDWTHANALRWNEDRGTVWVSSRGQNSLVEVNPTDGVALTVMGGSTPNVEMAEGAVTPHGQHHIDFRGNRLLVHDNRDVQQGSRVVAYDLEFGEVTVARSVWEYVPAPTVYDFVLGDAAFVDDENLMVTWSTAGRLEQRSFAGESPWSASLLLGAVYGYSELVISLPGTTFVGNR